MKMCQPHWDQLGAAIDAAGLGGLVARSEREAAANISAELAGEDTAGNFDPLMNANWAIFSNALRVGGLYLMCLDEQGNEYCPLCEYARHNGGRAEPNDVADWINYAVRDQIEAYECIKQGKSLC